MIEPKIATVNGNDVTLKEAVSLAYWRGNLKFIDDTIDLRIVSDAAWRMGVRISTEELQKAADAFRSDQKLLKASAMKEWLAERGRTAAEWQEYLEQEMLADKLRNLLFDSKVNRYYEEHKQDFDRAVISRIILADETLAQELWHRIFDAEDDFHSMARSYSTDAATRPSGGMVGPVARSDLSPAVRAAVFGARAGEMIGPIPVREGWLLVKVEEHLPNFLDSEIRERVKAELFTKWLAEQREAVHVLKHLPKWD